MNNRNHKMFTSTVITAVVFFPMLLHYSQCCKIIIIIIIINEVTQSSTKSHYQKLYGQWAMGTQRIKASTNAGCHFFSVLFSKWQNHILRKFSLSGNDTESWIHISNAPLSCAKSIIPWKFQPNLTVSLRVILLTNEQTNIRYHITFATISRSNVKLKFFISHKAIWWRWSLFPKPASVSVYITALAGIQYSLHLPTEQWPD